MIGKGNRIWWRTINGMASGIVEAIEGYRYVVRLEDGRVSIVHMESARDAEGNKIEKENEK